MTTLLLGLRLSLRGGRAARVRFVLMALGCALGVSCLAAVLTIPAILSAHDGRAAARDPRPVIGATHARSAADTVFLERQTPYGAQPFTRVFVSRPEAGFAPAPPGVRRLPGPGDVLVSPRLRDLLIREPGLRPLLPGRITGTVGPAGLTGPEELYAYVGRTPAQLPQARPLARFGIGYAPSPAVDPSTLDMLRFTLACLVLLPLAVYLSVCARLSAESRSRRLASLRLLGLSAVRTQRVNAVETVSAALLGSVLGVGAYLLLNAVVSRTGLPGLKWYPQDGLPSAWTLVVCLLGCPALALLTGRGVARAAARDPLAVRRQDRPRPRRHREALLLLPALGVLVFYCLLGALGRDTAESATSAVLVPTAILATGLGLVLGLVPATRLLAGRLANTARSLPVTLAMRRNQTQPGTSLRVVTGLVLLVYAASLTQGVLIELSQVSRPSSPTQIYATDPGALTLRQRTLMTRAEGVRAHALVMDSYRRDLGSDEPVIQAAVATCAQFAAFTKGLRGCVDGRVQRLFDPSYPSDPAARPGRVYAFEAPGASRGVPARRTRITLPREAVTTEILQPSHLVGAALLVPPSALPAPPGAAGALAASGFPAGTELLLAGDADPAAVRAVLDALGAIAPTAVIEPVGVNVEALSQITVIKSLLGAGMILGLVIGVAAFIVSAADRSLDRRGQITTLTLLGARGRTLRAAQCAQVLLPLALGLGAALVTGRLAEASYLVTGGGEIHWDWAGLPLLLLCVLGVLLLTALASLPLVRRHLDPELLGRD